MSVRDADIEITISPDGLEATVTGYASAEGGGKVFTSQSLLASLKNAGITVPPIKENAKKLIEGMQKGIDVTGIVIAKGTPPVKAVDGSLRPFGNFKRPVFPGEAFAELLPPQASRTGKTVTGKGIPAPGEPNGKGIDFPKGSYCFIDTTSLQIRSERYGIVRLDKRKLSVQPLIQVTPDHMSVVANIYPYDFRGKKITQERIQEALKEQELHVDLNSEAFTNAIKEATEKGHEIPNVPIAYGEQPQSGEDGWFELYVKDNRSTVGIENKKTGAIDFRARGVIQSVATDSILGKLHAPTRGIPGKDVFGRVIPARDGVVFRITVGENVEALEENSEYKALISGMVFFIQNTLSVTEVFMTRGDVNMATGNLELEKGSVHVRGAVLSGFSILSPRNILVEDVIESATIQAGGDVEVRGGIIMEREGKISAKGGVSAMFAKGANIEAQGDVNIAHEMSNCIIYAGQNVVATKGRGKIIGSTVRCGGTITANEVGSELEVTTTIILGNEQEWGQDYSERKRELKTLLQKIYGSLGSGNPRTILINTQADQREAVAKVLKMRLGAEKELHKIEERTIEERAAMKKAMNASLKVIKTIHPGTIINAYGLVLKVKKPIEHSKVYYNPDEERIVVTSL